MSWKQDVGPDIPAPANVSPQALAEARSLLTNFEAANEKRFTLERIVSEGSFGVTVKMRIRETSVESTISQLSLNPTNPTKHKHFIVKRSLRPDGQQSIRNEIKFLQKLRGAIHISQPYRIDDSSEDNKLDYLKGPTLCIEWIENGLLYDFVERVGERGKPLPNRMLWRMFLCLCRFVVALAWPPGRNDTANPEIERIPGANNGEQPAMSQLLHLDFHNRNIMINGFDEGEHELVPMLKLIDFGMARDRNEMDPDKKLAPDEAVKANILAAGTTMLSIIGGSNKRGTAEMKVRVKGVEKTIRSYAKDLDEISRSYRMPPALVNRHNVKLENLDADLKDLVARCCASNPRDRPDLEDLIEDIEHNVKTKEEGDYAGKPYQGQESNKYISRIVKDMIIDAKTDVEEETPKLSPFGMPSVLDPPLGPRGPPYGGFDPFGSPPGPGGFYGFGRPPGGDFGF